MISGVITAVLMLAFIGITFWAWSGRRRADFEAAARLPLSDEPLEAQRPPSSPQDPRP